MRRSYRRNCGTRCKRLGSSKPKPAAGSGATPFRGGSQQEALRAEGVLLLRRDSLAGVAALVDADVYLVPPALMPVRQFLRQFGRADSIAPVIVMAGRPNSPAGLAG